MATQTEACPEYVPRGLYFGLMAIALNRPVSGHVFRVERKQGPVWYAKYRLPDGRQVQKKLGPAWTQRGRPPVGHLTKHTAQAWLRTARLRPRLSVRPSWIY